MRSADDIVRRNAQRFISEAKAAAEERGDRLTDSEIHRRMAEATGYPVKTVARAVGRYLDDGHLWRIDYIEALAAALGRHTSEFVLPLPTDASIPEASKAQSLYSVLGKRLSLKDTRVLVRHLHHLLNRRPLFDLAMRVLAAIADAESQAEARITVSDILADSDPWSGKGSNRRRKTGSAKKS